MDPSGVSAAAGLAEVVAFLKRPESHSPRPSEVEAIETHMAWVFLAGDVAYKLKKPVHRPSVDFSTLELRRRDCQAELRLNRRLAPDVYLDLVPVTLASHGELALGGQGRPVVEWLIKMRRLPRRRMLDVVLRSGRVDTADLVSVGRLLGTFFRAARPVRLAPEVHRGRLAREIVLSRRTLRLLDDARLVSGRAAGILERRLDAVWPEIRERAELGALGDRHADLRPEHVCLLDPPVIIDCLEFNDDLRVLDYADDLAVLLVECDRAGAHEAGCIVAATVWPIAGALPSDSLLDFYKGLRAYVRARLAAMHHLEPPIRPTDPWHARMHDYLNYTLRVLPG